MALKVSHCLACTALAAKGDYEVKNIQLFLPGTLHSQRATLHVLEISTTFKALAAVIVTHMCLRQQSLIAWG